MRWNGTRLALLPLRLAGAAEPRPRQSYCSGPRRSKFRLVPQTYFIQDIKLVSFFPEYAQELRMIVLRVNV